MKLFARDGDSLIRAVGMLIGGLGLGAALMYVLDPERGKRRRGGPSSAARSRIRVPSK